MSSRWKIASGTRPFAEHVVQSTGAFISKVRQIKLPSESFCPSLNRFNLGRQEPVRFLSCKTVATIDTSFENLFMAVPSFLRSSSILRRFAPPIIKLQLEVFHFDVLDHPHLRGVRRVAPRGRLTLTATTSSSLILSSLVSGHNDN